MVKIKYIVIIIVVLGLLGFLYWLSRKKDLSFDFNLGGNVANLFSDVVGRSQRDATKGLGVYIDVPLTTTITNKARTAAILSNLVGSISYQGEPIMQTKADSTVLQNVVVAGRSSTPVSDTVQILVNPSTIKFLNELVKGKKPVVKYNFATTIAGKPYSFTNSTSVNQ